MGVINFVQTYQSWEEAGSNMAEGPNKFFSFAMIVVFPFPLPPTSKYCPVVCKSVNLVFDIRSSQEDRKIICLSGSITVGEK